MPELEILFERARDCLPLKNLSLLELYLSLLELSPSHFYECISKYKPLLLETYLSLTIDSLHLNDNSTRFQHK